MRHSSLFALLTSACLMVGTTSARADAGVVELESSDRDALTRLPTLAFLGQLSLGGRVSGEEQPGSTLQLVKQALLPGYGGGAELSVPAGQFFAVGALVHYARLKVDGAARSIGFLDGAFVPRLQYAFGGDPLIMRAFLELQIGVGWADLPEEVSSAAVSISPVFRLSPIVGFELFASKHVGVLLELGWLYHVFSLKTPLSDQFPIYDSVTFEYQSFVTQLGVMFVLGSVDD